MIAPSLLRHLQLSGTLWGPSEMRGAWTAQTEAVDSALLYAPLSGRLYLRLIDTKAPAVVLNPGNIALLPTGAAHEVSSVAIDTPAMAVDELLRMRRDRQNAVLRFNGIGQSPIITFWATQSYWREHAMDIVRWLLPPLLVIPATQEAAPGVHALAQALEKLGQENRDETPMLLNQIATALVQAVIARNAGGASGDNPIYDAALAMSGRSVPSPTTIATQLGLPDRTFTRRFQQLTGETPQSYIRGQRLRRAATLLEAGVLSVAEIADTCGYRSVTSFTKAFRAEFGHAPSQWRFHVRQDDHH